MDEQLLQLLAQIEQILDTVSKRGTPKEIEEIGRNYEKEMERFKEIFTITDSAPSLVGDKVWAKISEIDAKVEKMTAR